MAAAEADRVFRSLLDDVAWEERHIVLFGRSIPQPRLIAWAGEIPYRYSGQTLEPRPWSDLMDRVRVGVSRHTGVAFNHVLLNRYRSGRDSMGFHSDDEPELGPEPTIASVSFGVPRRFVLVSRRGPRERVVMTLEHGSLIVMRGRCQAEYRHGIPKDSAVSSERASLTFRRVLRPPVREV
jgi:alkylated DNA repair dioxygenase AlkB